MQKIIPALMIIVVAAVMVFSLATFTVDEREFAIKFQFGEAIKADYEPGLYFKMPFVNTVKKFDKRIQTLDLDPEPVLSAEKKNLIVDVFVKWRIDDDVTQYYQSLRGDSALARSRLGEIIKDGLRTEFAKRSIQEVISEDRRQIRATLTERLGAEATPLGVKILDVRMRRIDLPENVSASVYARMEQERQKVAKELRSQGKEEAEKIQATADREFAVMIAEAYRDSEMRRGEGDATAASKYATAFQQDAEFYSFYRSLTAYRQAFSNDSGVVVLEPDSEFFEYFNSGGSKK